MSWIYAFGQRRGSRQDADSTMKYQFSDVRVDGDARQICRGSQIVHLPRKAFDLLLLLLERRPNAVSKEQIHEHLWPDTYVSESSVQALVSDIRQAIGDDGRRRVMLRTVHGVGYAFSMDAVEERQTPAPAREPVRAWLVGERDRIALYAGQNTLGRGGDDVTEIDDSTVSRRHASIVVRNDQAVLEDLGSKNGTWLGEQRVSAPIPLKEGNVVLLGSARFVFRLAHSEGSTDSVPPRDAADATRKS